VKPLAIATATLAPDLPQPVAAAQAVSDNATPPGYILPWGSQDGVEANVLPRTSGFAFNPAGSGAWTTVGLTGTGVARGYYGVAVHPVFNMAYLVGGKVGGQDSSAVDVFSPLQRVIEQGGSAMAVARHDVAAVYLDGFLYAIGGMQGTVAQYAVERAPIGQTGYPGNNFTARANTLNARAGANAVAVNHQIWLFGGGFRPVEVYSPDDDRWSYLTDAAGRTVATPTGWSNATMIPVGDRLYFFGGSKEDGQPVTEISEFSTTTKTWRSLGPIPAIADLPPAETPATRMAGVFNNGTFYLMGGISLPQKQVTKRVIAVKTL
jgi:hypothetical protein